MKSSSQEQGDPSESGDDAEEFEEAWTQEQGNPSESGYDAEEELKKLQSFPDIYPIALRAASIPDSILSRCPLLDSLAKINLKSGLVAHPSSIQEYYSLNRKYWTRPWISFIGVLGMGLSFMGVDQVTLVEEELARIPDSEWGSKAFEEPRGQSASGDALRPIWKSETGELIARGNVITKIPSQAATLRSALDKFQEANWPESIASPFSNDFENARKTYNFVHQMNKKKLLICFRSCPCSVALSMLLGLS